MGVGNRSSVVLYGFLAVIVFSSFLIIEALAGGFAFVEFDQALYGPAAGNDFAVITLFDDLNPASTATVSVYTQVGVNEISVILPDTTEGGGG